VRGTVRDTTKEEKVKFLHDLGDIELFSADLLNDGSFEEAVKGMYICLMNNNRTIIVVIMIIVKMSFVVSFKCGDAKKENKKKKTFCANNKKKKNPPQNPPSIFRVSRAQ